MSIVIGFTCGSFDLLHAGHLLMLEEVRKQCDYLVVGLQDDPSVDRPHKHKPIETLEERLIRLRSCKYVDSVFVYTTERSLYSLIRKLNPSIRFVGADWKGKHFTGDDLPIKVVYNSRDHNYSSSNLIKRIRERRD
jgi:glycerol-3-phosphate cytidylyltransferase